MPTPTPPTYGNLLKILNSQPFTQLLQELQSNSHQMSSYITELNSIIATVIPSAPDKMYTPLPDAPIPFPHEKRLETTTDVANDDTNQLLFQQNTMYIMGTITCATLILSSLFFARDR